jgi:ADP-heptose:LPS heptosyltransferase
MGLGNQIQFIPVIKSLLQNDFEVVSDSDVYQQLRILTRNSDTPHQNVINFTVFGYDFKRVIRNRLKYSGKLYGFKYRIKGHLFGFGYTKSLDYDYQLGEVENVFRLLKFVGIDDSYIDYSIPRLLPVKKNTIALGISSKGGKEFPHWEKLAYLLKKDGYEVYAFGDYKIKNVENPPTPTLQDLQQWFSQMEYYIGVDSGIMHIADAMKIPMLVMFGATHVRKNQPYNKPNIVLKPKIECAPCYGIWGQVDCYQNPKFQCMFYSVDEVYRQFNELKRITSPAGNTSI